MARLREVPRAEATGTVLSMYNLLFGDRDPVVAESQQRSSSWLCFKDDRIGTQFTTDPGERLGERFGSKRSYLDGLCHGDAWSLTMPTDSIVVSRAISL